MVSSIGKNSADDHNLPSLEAASPVEEKFSEDHVQQVSRDSDAHLGVKKVEASYKVYGKYSKWVLFISCVFFLLYPFYRLVETGVLGIASVLLPISTPLTLLQQAPTWPSLHQLLVNIA